MKISLHYYAIICLGSITMGISAAFVVPQQNQHVFGISVNCPAKAKNMGVTNSNSNSNSRLSSSTKLNEQKLLRYDEKYGSLEKAGVCMDLEPVKNKQQAKPIAALNMKQTDNNAMKPKGLRYDAKYGDLEKAAVLMEPASASASAESVGGVPAEVQAASSSAYASEKQAGGGMVVAPLKKKMKAPAQQKKVMDPYESCLKYDKKYGGLEKAGVLMDF